VHNSDSGRPVLPEQRGHRCTEGKGWDEGCVRMAERLAPAARHTFAHDGRPIYQWDQTLDEVNVYVATPPVPAKQLFCTVQPTRVAFGLQGNPPFLDVRRSPTLTDAGRQGRPATTRHALNGIL